MGLAMLSVLLRFQLLLLLLLFYIFYDRNVFLSCLPYIFQRVNDFKVRKFPSAARRNHETNEEELFPPDQGREMGEKRQGETEIIPDDFLVLL